MMFYEEVLKVGITKETWEIVVNAKKSHGLNAKTGYISESLAYVMEERIKKFPLSLCRFLSQLLLGYKFSDMPIQHEGDRAGIAGFIMNHENGFPEHILIEARKIAPNAKKKKKAGRPKGTKNKKKEKRELSV